MAASKDGSKVLVVGYQQMFASTDYGVTWVDRNIPDTQDWSDVVATDDGSVFYGVESGDLYRSTDLGVTWTLVNGTTFPNSYKLHIAADGKLPTYNYNDIYASTDGGGTWTEFTDYISTDTWWTSTVVSGDATRLFMTPYNQQVITGAVLGASTGGNTGGATGNAGGSTPPASATPSGTAGSGALANTGLSQDLVIGTAGLFIVAAILMIGRQLLPRR